MFGGWEGSPSLELLPAADLDYPTKCVSRYSDSTYVFVRNTLVLFWRPGLAFVGRESWSPIIDLADPNAVDRIIAEARSGPVARI